MVGMHPAHPPPDLEPRAPGDPGLRVECDRLRRELARAEAEAAQLLAQREVLARQQPGAAPGPLPGHDKDRILESMAEDFRALQAQEGQLQAIHRQLQAHADDELRGLQITWEALRAEVGDVPVAQGASAWESVLAAELPQVAARMLGALEAPSEGGPLEKANAPGPYVVAQAVTVTAGASSHSPEIGELGAGTCVHVLDVEHVAEEGVTRGRIQSPAGWISLVRASDNFRWAMAAVSQLSLQVDAPGAYLVTRPVTVTTRASSWSSGVAELSSGTWITVLEVVSLAREGRIRGRVASPPGWISLRSTGDGRRWAARPWRSCELDCLRALRDAQASRKAELTSRVAHCQARCGALEAERSKFDGQASELREACASLRGAWALHMTRLDVLLASSVFWSWRQVALAGRRDRCPDPRLDYRTYESERRALLQELELDGARCSALDMERKEIASEAAAERARLAALSTEQSELSARLQEQADLAERYARESSVRGAQVEEVRCGHARLAEDNRKLRLEVEHSRSERGELAHRSGSAASQVLQMRPAMDRSAAVEAKIKHLRAENTRLAERHTELASEIAELNSDHTQLEAQCCDLKERVRQHSELTDQHAVDRGRLQAERDHLKGAHASLEVRHRLLGAEAAQLRANAAEPRGDAREAEALRRQVEQHALERGALDAEVARLRAENSVLRAETQDLSGQLQRAGPPPGTAPAPPRGTASPERAFAAAEQWVLYHSTQPMDLKAGLTYMGRVTVEPHDFAHVLAPVVAANRAQRDRAASAVENGSMACAALHAYRLHDEHRRGYLEWDNGDIYDFVAAVFRQHALSPPAHAEVHAVYQQFDRDRRKLLEAEECLCLADALLRLVLLA